MLLQLIADLDLAEKAVERELRLACEGSRRSDNLRGKASLDVFLFLKAATKECKNSDVFAS